MKPFELGTLVMITGVEVHLTINKLYDELILCLKRHASGDWGSVGAQDKLANDEAVENGDRIISAYMLGAQKIWIITEADRSSTTVLFPSDY